MVITKISLEKKAKIKKKPSKKKNCLLCIFPLHSKSTIVQILTIHQGTRSRYVKIGNQYIKSFI